MTLAARGFTAFALGAALMLVFDSTPFRVAGLLLMLAGVIGCAFAIATPEFLRGDSER